MCSAGRVRSRRGHWRADVEAFDLLDGDQVVAAVPGVVQRHGRLDITGAARLREAFDGVMANARKVEPPPRINRVLVQPVVPAGVEIMVGARVDAQLGPLIGVGLGGIFVELLRDTRAALNPLICAGKRIVAVDALIVRHA